MSSKVFNVIHKCRYIVSEHLLRITGSILWGPSLYTDTTFIFITSIYILDQLQIIKKERKKAKQILSICAKGGQTSLHRLHIGVRAFYKRLLVRSLMTNVQSTSLLTV